jgi:hypothetical protein
VVKRVPIPPSIPSLSPLEVFSVTSLYCPPPAIIHSLFCAIGLITFTQSFVFIFQSLWDLAPGGTWLIHYCVLFIFVSNTVLRTYWSLQKLHKRQLKQDSEVRGVFKEKMLFGEFLPKQWQVPSIVSKTEQIGAVASRIFHSSSHVLLGCSVTHSRKRRHWY